MNKPWRTKGGGRCSTGPLEKGSLAVEWSQRSGDEDLNEESLELDCKCSALWIEAVKRWPE